MASGNRNIGYNAILNGLLQMFIERMVDDWELFYVNFMPQRLPSGRRAAVSIMQDDICRIYAILLKHSFHHPNTQKNRDHLPLFIGCPDFPVPKRDRQTKRVVLSNDGIHFNGLIALSPLARIPSHLGEHFSERSTTYCPPDRHFARIHVTPVNDTGIRKVVDYTFKCVTTGMVSDEDVLVLPRSLSELRS